MRTIPLLILLVLICVFVPVMAEDLQELLGKKPIEYILKKARYKKEVKEEREKKREALAQKYKEKREYWIQKRYESVKFWEDKKEDFVTRRKFPDRVRMAQGRDKAYGNVESRQKLAKKWGDKKDQFLKEIREDSFVSGR